MVESSQRQRSSLESRAPVSFESRVVIENVQPEIDGGKFPVKRVLGERVAVTANIHTDGHNILRGVLLCKHSSESDWHVIQMQPVGAGLDLFRADFDVDVLGTYEFTLSAWIDQFANWRRDTSKKIAAGQEIAVEIIEGAQLLEKAIARAQDSRGAEELTHYLSLLKGAHTIPQSSPLLTDRRLDELMLEFADRGRACHYERVLQVTVEPEYALFSSWYEVFPRSCSFDAGKHGTFQDLIKRLPYIADMGFDVLYLPPIHPIGVTKRKGKNNTLVAHAGDPGSPWAIGAREGGHKAIHPDLGTFEDFDSLVSEASAHGIRIALDIAFQASPDHPYVSEHPEWFYHRPEGSIKYAENPPKKYEDIYPIDFECEQWEQLWHELTSIFLFWVERGVHIFRVDNPHTKPYAFWRYAIERVRAQHPDVIFLSEAFARPNIMQQLAKVGFSQSYTYFTWRTSKWELTDYLTELTRSNMVEYFRPNFFANTPDILPENLQYGGRNSFLIRVTLAATLSAAYGIYGPAFELCINEAVPGTEEYLNSEKYEVKNWRWDDPISISDYISRLNRIRRTHTALHNNRSLRFLQITNDNMIAYCKTGYDSSDIIICVVNLDPYNAQSGVLTIPLYELGIDNYYQVHDLITDRRYNWSTETNLVQLPPQAPAYIFRVRQRIHREHDFDYFV
jgi:starch synthase (maltosyl-transferring)